MALAFLVAWGAWLWQARVSVYATSASARIEAHGAIHPVAATVAGRVRTAHGRVGSPVAEGAPLLELDAEEERRRLEREQAQLSSLKQQLELLRREITAQGRASLQADAAAGLVTDEARQRYEEASAATRQADAESERAARLHADGLLSDTDYGRLKTEADKRHAVAEALKAGQARATSDRSSGGSSRVARDAELQRLLATLTGQRAESEAAAAAAAVALDKRVVRAPVTGRLAEWADPQVGTFIKEGDRVGAVLEPSELKIVAQFEPSGALGRIRSGQVARMRLGGFPWTQYGALPARVTLVAEELRDERIRVELALDRSTPAQVALQHGLPGVVEVEVERVAPITLVLRWVGALTMPAQAAER